jgi:hypothetical protein
VPHLEVIRRAHERGLGQRPSEAQAAANNGSATHQGTRRLALAKRHSPTRPLLALVTPSDQSFARDRFGSDVRRFSSDNKGVLYM